MNERRHGKVVTFYSYKGGTGRTMALANVAWILAANGKRVLVADWDLESPGLHRFFHPFLDEATLAGCSGIIDMIRTFEAAATHEDPTRQLDWHREYAKVLQHAVSLDWDFGAGALDFLSAGAQNRDYSASVTALDWDNFYERLGGGLFFDALRENMQAEYDYTLIDSRTGLNDVADICTVHLPDLLVTCFTLSDQGIGGASTVARHVSDRYAARGIRILPVPMRIDDAEKERADAGRALARHRFEGLPANLIGDELTSYWGEVEIPYRPFYAYEEILATFGDRRGIANSLLSAFERLTSHITDKEVTLLPEVPESERQRVLKRFTRRAPQRPLDAIVSHVPEDRLWAEWITAALEAAGVSARLAETSGQAAAVGDEDEGTWTFAVLSPAYMASPAAQEFVRKTAPGTAVRGGPFHLIEVADTRLAPPLSREAVVRLCGLPTEDAALKALSEIFDHSYATQMQQSGPRLPRFPGRVPSIWDVPPRNANFTGRNPDIDRLRDKLDSNSVAVVLPVALHGLGGVGKSQVALEYVHRFKSDYDLVWWVNADKPDLVSDSLTKLAGRLGVRVGGSVTDAAQEVLSALREGKPTSRWLIVFDNAEDPAALAPFLPEGAGHVLITTRIVAWTQNAASLEVDVFSRAESVEHLRRRVPGITSEDAAAVASRLGDLPLAVEVAAAWLADTGTPVATYLDALERETARALSIGHPADYPSTLDATWSISLERLAEQSPAAVRLLQVCAFMAPEISHSLVVGDEMAAELRKIDASLSEPLLRGRVVRELVRLSLARIDSARQSVQIHRLVQAVMRSRLSEEERAELEHVVHVVLAGARPKFGDSDDPANWPVYDAIWPHLETSRAQHCGEEPIRQLFTERVRYLRKVGNYAGALDLAEPLAEQWERELARDEADEAASARNGSLRQMLLHLRFQIANNYRAKGQYEDALAIDEDVLEQQKALLGTDHPHTLMTAGSLAADLRAAGRFREALDLDLSTLDRLRDTLGEDHPRSLSAANNLAVSYRLVGECYAAKELDAWVLDRRRLTLGTSYPETLFSADHLGRDLREAGEYQESINLLDATLPEIERVLGPDSLSAIETRSNLAVSLRKAGQLERARHEAETSHARALRVARDQSIVTANICALNLATCLSASGEHQRAAELITPVQEWYDGHLGSDHPYALLCHVSMAICMRGLGASDLGLSEARRAHTALAESLGPHHRFTLAAAVTLANCLGDLGEAVSAEILEREAAGAFATLLGPTHPDTLACESNLAVSLYARGMKAEAGRIRERIVKQMANQLGERHRNTLKADAGQRINIGLEAQPI